VPVTVRLCWTAKATSTAAGHQHHCCRCTTQSQGLSLRQREVGAAGARGRSNPLAGGNCLHDASRQACCQSVRAIRTQDRADNLLAGARGHAARRNPRQIRTQTSRRLHSMGHDTAGFTNSIKFRSATARRFCFMLRLENKSNIG
jgi:hypothetical protein